MFVTKSQTPSPFILTGQPLKGKDGTDDILGHFLSLLNVSII